jgi:hypothetical protein
LRYAVVDSGSPTPTAEAIKSASSAGVVSSGTEEIKKRGKFRHEVGGLAPAREYDIHFIIQSQSGQLGTVRSMTNIATSRQAPGVPSPSAKAVEGSTECTQLSCALSMPGQARYAVAEVGAQAPKGNVPFAAGLYVLS